MKWFDTIILFVIFSQLLITCSLFQALPDDVLDFKAKIQLENVERDYHIVECYGCAQNCPTEEPLILYFGQWVRE